MLLRLYCNYCLPFIVSAILAIYFWLVVYSFYQELKQQKRDEISKTKENVEGMI